MKNVFPTVERVAFNGNGTVAGDCHPPALVREGSCDVCDYVAYKRVAFKSHMNAQRSSRGASYAGANDVVVKP